MTDVPFKVGDRVKKRSGYEYPGFIVSVFTNRAGAVRYVVEADHSAFSGMLHIFNGDQIENREGKLGHCRFQIRPLGVKTGGRLSRLPAHVASTVPRVCTCGYRKTLAIRCSPSIDTR